MDINKELEAVELQEEQVEQPAPPRHSEQPLSDVEVISVRFKKGGKSFYFDPDGLEICRGENVIVDTARGIEYGECSEERHLVPGSKIVPPLKKVLRLATEQDRQILESNSKKEEKAFDLCQQMIDEQGLDMKLVEVEYSFDGSKILFFFTSGGRVDFRKLVKNLAAAFRTRIELRQIGVRDEAKMLGGIGICGREFCCGTFLDNFQPVSIKMAKTQNLSLNPVKISGACGRLMCCLKYEQDAYEHMLKDAPKNESYVSTPEGKGTITEVNLLKGQVKVRLDSEPENAKSYDRRDIRVIRSGRAAKGKAGEAETAAAEEPAAKEIAPLNEKEFIKELLRDETSSAETIDKPLKGAEGPEDRHKPKGRQAPGEKPASEAGRKPGARRRGRPQKPRQQGEDARNTPHDKPQAPRAPKSDSRPSKTAKAEGGQSHPLHQEKPRNVKKNRRSRPRPNKEAQGSVPPKNGKGSQSTKGEV